MKRHGMMSQMKEKDKSPENNHDSKWKELFNVGFGLFQLNLNMTEYDCQAVSFQGNDTDVYMLFVHPGTGMTEFFLIAL